MIFFDHDIHCHTYLSSCSGDLQMTYENIVKHAEESKYSVVCITDHFWDERIGGAGEWYKEQNFNHIIKSLPKPASSSVKVLFGCETEYYWGREIALSKERADKFDFIAIPVNHFNMRGLTIPQQAKTAEEIAEIFTQKLERLITMDLPWEKIGIAHLNNPKVFFDVDCCSVFRMMNMDRLCKVFNFFAKNKVGIEINASCFRNITKDNFDDMMYLLKLARENECLFYCGSDAHHPNDLEYSESFKKAVEALALTDKDRFIKRYI